ncbi:unnamed protein product [Acanthoscelides obtectus]|uniref:Uncharacterized protein n=2 Tax=Acanthoscelides obtectus TaxID=200917 RepID=A0A9P0P6L0_ACAOB|nr:unnamed protein product [Acanthoscelides obtectus]
MEPKLTGQILAQTVKHFIKTNNLDSKLCVSIGTDTCNLMLGEQKGAVMELQKCLPKALKSPCANHALNLSISKSSSVQAVRNTVGIMKEVIAFFKASAKRNTVLKRKLDGYQIHSMCETQWTERHVSVLKSDSKFEKIVECLCDILALIVNLSKILQSKTIDKQYAVKLIGNIISVVQERRANSEKHFRILFASIMKSHETQGIELTMPRITSRQMNRLNIVTSNKENHYRLNLYVPLLDNILQDLVYRFNEESLNIYNFNIFFASVYNSKTEAEVMDILETISKYTYTRYYRQWNVTIFHHAMKTFFLQLIDAFNY